MQNKAQAFSHTACTASTICCKWTLQHWPQTANAGTMHDEIMATVLPVLAAAYNHSPGPKGELSKLQSSALQLGVVLCSFTPHATQIQETWTPSIFTFTLYWCSMAHVIHSWGDLNCCSLRQLATVSNDNGLGCLSRLAAKAFNLQVTALTCQIKRP